MGPQTIPIRVGVLTISDRSFQGSRPDASGPALEDAVRAQGWTVEKRLIIPDDFQMIRQTLIDWAGSGMVDLVVTTGGTGFSPRDVTPEATREVIDREAPGLAEAMRQVSLKVTPHAMLSRAVSGIRGRTLVVNLPGSPKAALENLEVILPVLPHAVQLLQNDPGSEAGHSVVINIQDRD
jgi:molybdopterin adenylyltransferase